MMLEEHPLAGRARDEIRPGLRSVLVSPHVIFYRVRGDIAQIIRILDGRRDVEDIFADG
jgi:toxin ParE1/3/4